MSSGSRDRKRGDLMKGVSDHFYRLFLNFLHENGLTPVEHATPEEPPEIYRNREYICSFCEGGRVYYENTSRDLIIIKNHINNNLSSRLSCRRLFQNPIIHYIRRLEHEK
jgi:hypothetical protein